MLTLGLTLGEASDSLGLELPLPFLPRAAQGSARG